MDKEFIIAQIPAAEYIAEYRDIKRFIKLCKECKCYTRTWTCPPFETETGSYIDNKGQKIEDFSIATIIGVKINLELELRLTPKSNEELNALTYKVLSEVRREVDEKLLRLEHQISPSLLYYAGPCMLCPPNECSRINQQPCRYPEKMRSTLEADGFDIGRTCSELLGVEIKWCDKLVLPEYFTLCYGFLGNEVVVDKISLLLNVNSADNADNDNNFIINI